jgi:molybdenum cofactor synthesis domain-containing protein
VISLDAARDHVFGSVRRLDAVTLPIASADGLVLAEDVTSAEQVPPFANTAVDGYAVRASDTKAAPVVLDVVGELAAGSAGQYLVGPGQAVRIMTGAPMPTGADAVVMVEDTERLDGGTRVRVTRAVDAGDAIRAAGSDIEVGSLVFRAGTVLNGPSLGVLASVNRREVAVYRPARVAVLSTGDELVDDGSPLRQGQIRESNKTMLIPLVRGCGAEVVDFGVVRDDEVGLEAVLRAAARTCDAVITSGGVSMGDYDVVKAVLSRIADMAWMQIAIKPAKPFAFGLLDGVPVFGLPGNPVSSMVSFEVLARPALRRMMGHDPLSADRPCVRAVVDEALKRSADGKVHLTRVFGAFGPDGRLHVRTTGPQASHQLAAAAQADGLAIVADGDGVAVGGEVAVWMLRALGGPLDGLV